MENFPAWGRERQSLFSRFLISFFITIHLFYAHFINFSRYSALAVHLLFTFYLHHLLSSGELPFCFYTANHGCETQAGNKKERSPSSYTQKRTGEEREPHSPSRLSRSGNRLQKRTANHLERFSNRDQPQELYTSYEHIIIKPSMICCDFCRHRQSFITGGIKENTRNGSDREKTVSRRFLPDIEEKSYRYVIIFIY